MDEKIFMMIDSYIDGELNRNDEDILFEQLALNRDVRDYLRKVNLVKNQTRLSSGGFPSSLERNILTSVRSRTTPRLSGGARLAGYISAGISIILLAHFFCSDRFLITGMKSIRPLTGWRRRMR